MRKDSVLILLTGFVAGALAHAGWTAARAPHATHGHEAHPAGASAGNAASSAAARTSSTGGTAAGAASGAGEARPSPEGSAATAHSLPGRGAAAAAPTSTARAGEVPKGSAGGTSGASTASSAEASGGAGAGEAPAGATATAGKPTSAEAINAFRALAKEGAGAFGQHGALVEQFRALGPEGIALLADLLRDSSSGARFLAAAILEGLKDPSTIGMLDAATQDPDLLVQRMASHALALMGAPEAKPALERAMNEAADWGVKVNSAYGLAKQGEQSGRDFLLATFRDKENPMGAMIVLGPMIDIGAPEFSAELRPMIGNTSLDLGMRMGAAMCAAKAKDRDALPALEAVIGDPGAPDSLKDTAKKAVNEITGEARYTVD